MGKVVAIIVVSWVLGIMVDVFYGGMPFIGAVCWCIGALGGFIVGLQYNEKEEK